MPGNGLDLYSVAVAAGAAVLGGLCRWWKDEIFSRTFTWTLVAVFVVDMVISAGIGILAFWVASDLGQPGSVAAASAAVAGNFGSKAFDLIRSLVTSKLSVAK